MAGVNSATRSDKNQYKILIQNKRLNLTLLLQNHFYSSVSSNSGYFDKRFKIVAFSPEIVPKAFHALATLWWTRDMHTLAWQWRFNSFLLPHKAPLKQTLYKMIPKIVQPMENKSKERKWQMRMWKKNYKCTVIPDMLVARPHMVTLWKWSNVLPVLSQIEDDKSIWISRLHEFPNINSSEAQRLQGTWRCSSWRGYAR